MVQERKEGQLLKQNESQIEVYRACMTAILVDIGFSNTETFFNLYLTYFLYQVSVSISVIIYLG